MRQAEARRFDHVLIDEYQDTNGSQYRNRQGAGRRASQPVRRGRRRPIDLRLARRRGDAHPAVQARLARGQGRAAGRQLPLDRRDSCSCANTLIAFNRQRHDKVLQRPRPGGTRPAILQCQDETEEAERVVADIRQRIDSRQARSRATSPFSAARTSSRGRSKPSCGGPTCRTC